MCVIWTPHDIIIVEVPFESTPWECFRSTIIEFFKQYVTTEILTGTLKNKGLYESQTQEDVATVMDWDLTFTDNYCVEAAVESDITSTGSGSYCVTGGLV